jgi:1-acyl-sn-glycerol-3-phosphate acyltransferase
MQNLWCLLGTTGVEVEAVFLPVMSGERCVESGRANVAAHAHRVIRAAVVQCL